MTQLAVEGVEKAELASVKCSLMWLGHRKTVKILESALQQGLMLTFQLSLDRESVTV